MILSVTSVSSPYRGTPATYILGHRLSPGTGLRPFTFGHTVSLVYHTLAYFQPLIRGLADTHTEAHVLTYKEASAWSLLKNLWHSDWADGQDHAPFDVGLHSPEQRESLGEGEINSGTFYRSYSASITHKTSFNSHHTPSSRKHIVVPYFYWLSYYIGSYDYSQIYPMPKTIDHARVDSSRDRRKEWAHSSALDGYTHPDETLHANDGLVPVFSQWHPFDCSSTSCRHLGESICSKSSGEGEIEIYEDVEPGVWHVYHLKDANHCMLVPVWIGSTRQKTFFTDLGRWLGAVDAANSRRRKLEGRISMTY